MTKSGREIMEILEAYDLTGCAHSAAQLAGTDRKTVARYVALRDAGQDPAVPARRPRSADEFAGKVEELVDRSGGKIRADVVHRRLTAMGYAGFGADDPAGGRRGEGGVAGGAPADVPAVDPRAGDVAAVGLGRGPEDRRPPHAAVLLLAGVVTVPGRAAVVGPVHWAA